MIFGIISTLLYYFLGLLNIMTGNNFLIGVLQHRINSISSRRPYSTFAKRKQRLPSTAKNKNGRKKQEEQNKQEEH